MKILTFVAGLFLFQNVYALNLNVTYTNGSSMPISPGVIYAMKSNQDMPLVGTTASAGLTQLCMMGNPDLLIEELKKNPSVVFVQKVMGPTLPGKMQSTMIMLSHAEHLNVRFLAMYGKTKDTCADFEISNFDLRLLGRYVNQLNGKDQAVLTGGFSDPHKPAMEDMDCEGATDAISCLRALSSPMAGGSVRIFSAYLPSLLIFLEDKYGSADVQSLLFSPGSLQFSVKRVYND